MLYVQLWLLVFPLSSLFYSVVLSIFFCLISCFLYVVLFRLRVFLRLSCSRFRIRLLLFRGRRLQFVLINTYIAALSLLLSFLWLISLLMHLFQDLNFVSFLVILFINRFQLVRFLLLQRIVLLRIRLYTFQLLRVLFLRRCLLLRTLLLYFFYLLVYRLNFFLRQFARLPVLMHQHVLRMTCHMLYVQLRLRFSAL